MSAAWTWLNDPRNAVRLHLWLTVFWAVVTVPAVALIVIYRDNPLAAIVTLAWLTIVSHWANLASHWACWQSSRTEVKQDEMKEKADA